MWGKDEFVGRNWAEPISSNVVVILSLGCGSEEVAEDEAAEWPDNKNLEWVGHDEVQANGLDPD